VCQSPFRKKDFQFCQKGIRLYFCIPYIYMSGTLDELDKLNTILNTKENKAEYISSDKFKDDYQRTIKTLVEKLEKEGVSKSREEIRDEIKHFLKKQPENSDIVKELNEINFVVGGSKRRHKRKNTHKRSKRRSSYKRRTSKRL